MLSIQSQDSSLPIFRLLRSFESLTEASHMGCTNRSRGRMGHFRSRQMRIETALLEERKFFIMPNDVSEFSSLVYFVTIR